LKNSFPPSNTRKLIQSESCRRRTNENTRRRKVQFNSFRRTNENNRRRKVQLKFPTRIISWDFHTRTPTAIVCSWDSKRHSDSLQIISTSIG
jgi:hypothetical protein